MEDIGGSQEPTEGLNIAALLLSLLEKVANSRSLADELTKDHLRMGLRVARGHGLDDQQMKGFKEAVGSQTGVAGILGPPGSGKTRVISAIAITEAGLGHELGNRRPVLVCAPAHSHVDNLMDEILANLPKGHGLEITRFKGRYLKDNSVDESKEMDIKSEHKTTQEAKELERATLDFADASAPLTVERNYDYTSYDTRLRKIKQWAFTHGSRAPHPMADTAVAYLDLMRKIKAGKSDKVEWEKRRSDIKDLLWVLTQHYVAHTVDILFCTNIAAADRILREFGRFRVVLQEEPLGAFVADDATPLANFKETCELLVLVGSDKPHNNIPMMKGAVEDVNLTEASLFEVFARDRLNADSVVALDVQYRMHPQLFKPVNDIFYGGDMKDASSCSAESDVYNTWEHYLQGLRPAWNGNRRLAIDVSGDGIESHRSDEGASWANEAEARLFCANFLGVVFYGAQGELITEKMFRFHINNPDRRIKVESVPNVQGAEGDIVLLSFARNIPDMPLDVGIIGKKNGLKVAFSRAKQSMVVIGNILAWCQEKIDENTLIAQKKDKMSQFGAYIQDILDENDGISYGDIQRFLNGEDILEAEFPKLLRPKLDGTGNIEQARTTAKPDEQDSGTENKAEQKVRKARRDRNLKTANNQKKQNWLGDYRDRGGRGGRGGGAVGSSTART